MILEMESVMKVFEKYDIQVFRPEVIDNYNQIFSRDIGFVIDDKFISANILPERDQEITAIHHVLSKIPKENRISLPEECYDDGGDVMPRHEYIFIGTYYGKEYPE